MRGWELVERRCLAPLVGLFMAALVFWVSLVPLDLSVIRSLRLGEEVLARGWALPDDPRISAPRDPCWVHQGWLLDAGLALVFRVHGPKGVMLAKAGLVALAFSILFSLLGRKGTPLAWRALLVIGSFWLSHVGHFPPKAAADLLFMAASVYLLASGEGTKRRRWLLVPLVALWANACWGFVLGLAVAWVWLASELFLERDEGRPTPVLFLLLGLGVAGGATPQPFSALLAAPRAGADWMAPYFHLAAPKSLLTAFFGILTLILLSKGQLHKGLTLAWATSFVGALLNTEWIPPFAWTCGVTMGELVNSWARVPRSTGRAPSGAGLLWVKAKEVVLWSASVALAGSLAWAEGGPRQWAFRSEVYPGAAMAVIKAQGAGQRLLNEARYGDSLLAALYPATRPFLLQEFGSASPQVYRDYLRLLPPPNPNWARKAMGEARSWYPPKGVHREWREVLGRHGFEWVLLTPGSQLAQLLGREKGWGVAAADPQSVLFRKGENETAAVPPEGVYWPPPARSGVALGLEALKAGNPFRALWHLRGAAGQGDPVALWGSAQAYRALGRKAQALEALREARLADAEGRLGPMLEALDREILGSGPMSGEVP